MTCSFETTLNDGFVARRLAGRRGPAVSPWLVLASVAGGAAAVSATAPIGDPDLPWHLEVGRQILDRRTLSGIGSGWSFAVRDRGWTTTQWLSEVILTTAHDVAGFRGLQVLRLIVALVLVLGLARLLLLGTEAFWGPVVFTLTLLALGPFLQARPQLASLPLLVWLSRKAWDTLHTDLLPPLRSLILVTFGWANLHGLWVMVPVTTALLAGCALLQDRPGSARGLLGRGAACLIVACLTPVGPALLLSPFRFASSTGNIEEWQPTTLRDPAAIVLDVLILLFVLAWVRSESSIPSAEVLFVLTLLGFAMLAFRNIAPTSVLLAPVLVHRLQATFPRDSKADSARERRVLVVVASTLSVLALVVGAVRTSTRAPLGPLLPYRLARELAADGRPHRVLNDYNVGGTLIHWGGARVQVAIDGRSDYYGGRGISAYLELLALKPGWRARLATLNPDRAVLQRDSPMTDQLLSSGWQRLDSQGSYLLLSAPGEADPP